MIDRLLTQIVKDSSSRKAGTSELSGNDYSEDPAFRSKSMSPSPNRLKNILHNIEVRTVFRQRGDLSQSPGRLPSSRDNSDEPSDLGTPRRETPLKLLTRRLTSVRSHKSLSKQASISFQELPETLNNRRAQLLFEAGRTPPSSNTVEFTME